MPTQDAKTTTPKVRIYDGEGDRLMGNVGEFDKVIVIPDADTGRHAASEPRLRILWGQELLQDLLDGRYRSIVCGVNAQDNSHGIIAQLAVLLPTSQWTEASITSHAARFVQRQTISVIKFDLDTVEVLGLLRPHDHPAFTLDDLAAGFKIAAEMIRRKPQRLPSASVSFLGAHANKLVDESGAEPSFETVLRTMYDAGYTGDVYPTPLMWRTASVGVYAHYPFPTGLSTMREGGY